VVAEALRDAGMQVMTHGEIFAPDAPDQDWLSFAGERGYIVLTKDRRIRRKLLEIEAIKQARVRAVILTVKGAKGAEIAGVILKALPRIVRSVADREGPCIFTLTKAGLLSEVGFKGARPTSGR
jgi:predicted nuclease of predicted toxin-antitoxin system